MGPRTSLDGVEKSLTLLGIEPWMSSPYPITILTELSWLSVGKRKSWLASQLTLNVKPSLKTFLPNTQTRIFKAMTSNTGMKQYTKYYVTTRMKVYCCNTGTD
jgi:hypothetical protein